MPVTCNDIINGGVTVQTQTETVQVVESSIGIVQVSSPGPQGPKGDKGDTGLSGAGEPFYSIVTGNLYATTASVAILASISSSLVPYTASGQFSFDVGSTSGPWRSLYVTESINFVSGGQVVSSITADANYIIIGDSKIGTSSFGFESPVIIKRGNYTDIDYTGSLEVAADGTNDIVRITSASVNYVTIDSSGIFIFGAFSYLPTPVPGGVIFSGSEFYVGK